MHEIVVPYVRSNIARIALVISPEATLAEARKIQTAFIGAIREQSGPSKLEGSRGQAIWAVANRKPEERNRVRALVTCKEFCVTYSSQLVPPPPVDLDWRRGKVFVGNKQVLGFSGDGEATDESVYLTDARGDHTGWFLKTPEICAALSLEPSNLQECWFDWLEKNPPRKK